MNLIWISRQHSPAVQRNSQRLPRTLRLHQHVALGVALLLLSSVAALAGEDAVLRRVLSVLSTAAIGDNYEAVRELVPRLGPLRSYAGDENAQAVTQTKIGKFTLRGSFGFSKGRLVSHGFSTGPLTHPQAHDFLLRCVAILEELHGSSERRIELPNESDGPRDCLGMSFSWHKKQTVLGLDFHSRREFATVSWGAQAE